MVRAESKTPTGPDRARTGSRPVFIVGCPRSGTTWLYHILLSAGRFAIYRSETNIYNAFAPAYGGFGNVRMREAFLRKWLRSEYFLRSGLDADAFYAKAIERGTGPGAMLRLLMEDICAYQHAERWAECTPEYALSLARIKRDFPEALFIHIVRDGRDVALSLAKQRFIRPLPWDSERGELAAGAYWSWIVAAAARQAEVFPDDVLVLKYEDLVTDYARALEIVSSFIGQRIDAARVADARIGSVSRPNTSFAAQNGAAMHQSIGRWQTELSAKRLAALEAVAGPMLDRFGYARGATASSARAPKLRAALYRARFAVMWRLRTRTPLGRFADDGVGRLQASDIEDDPTLRPAAHLGTIRRIVEG
ncbi:MAG TPA: sulfotransferase [Gammaproteobacteria bacterium]